MARLPFVWLRMRTAGFARGADVRRIRRKFRVFGRNGAAEGPGSFGEGPGRPWGGGLDGRAAIRLQAESGQERGKGFVSRLSLRREPS